jgi:hypothetical protein
MTATACAIASPLSPQQAMYWDAEQRGTIGYRLIASREHIANAFAAVRFRGALRLEILQRCANELLRRHACLRTRFETVDGRVLQIVTDTDEMPVVCVDTNREPAEAAARAALGRFDYRAGLLLRVQAIRLSSSDAIVVLAVPHIVSDSVSMQILVEELLTLYAHFLHGRPSPLAEPAVHYADFIRWQDEWLRGDVRDEVQRYVSSRFIGATPVQVPLDSDGDIRESSAADAGEIRFALDQRQLADVYAVSTARRVTPFVTMMSAFSVVLSRWTGQTDILTNAPFAARPDAAARRIVGMFSNLSPLRVHLSGDPSFIDLLEQVQETVLQAMRFRCVPHAVLAQALGDRGDISCASVGVNAVPDGGKVLPKGCRDLFGTSVAVEPYVIDTSAMAVKQMRAHLSLWIGLAAGGRITGRLMYRRASCATQTIAGLAQALLATVGALTREPARRISLASEV